MDTPSLIDRLRKGAEHWRQFSNRQTMRHAEMLDEAANEISRLTAERDKALGQSAGFRALNIPEHLRALDREVEMSQRRYVPYVWALELLHQSRRAHDAALRMSVRGAPIDGLAYLQLRKQLYGFLAEALEIEATAQLTNTPASIRLAFSRLAQILKS